VRFACSPAWLSGRLSSRALYSARWKSVLYYVFRACGVVTALWGVARRRRACGVSRARRRPRRS
jgi:hypothetical protein